MVEKIEITKIEALKADAAPAAPALTEKADVNIPLEVAKNDSSAPDTSAEGLEQKQEVKKEAPSAKPAAPAAVVAAKAPVKKSGTVLKELSAIVESSVIGNEAVGLASKLHNLLLEFKTAVPELETRLTGGKYQAMISDLKTVLEFLG